MIDQKLLKNIIEAVRTPERKTEAYDSTATVVRVEGSTAWVHIPGGVDETPVSMSVNASPGDTVRIRVAGGQAWVVGNDTSPPTDDKTAESAQRAVETLDSSLDPVGVFNRLTQNGKLQGIYKDPETGDYYINFSYGHGGTLTLGGLNNVNGVLQILDASGNVIGTWDKDGISASQAALTGKLTSGNGAIELDGYYITFDYNLVSALQNCGIRYRYTVNQQDYYQSIIQLSYFNSNRPYVSIASDAREIEIGANAVSVDIPALSSTTASISTAYVYNASYFYDNINVQKESGSALRLKSTGYNSKIGQTVPSSNKTLSSYHTFDSAGYQCAYMDVIKTSTDDLYYSWVVRRKNASDTVISMGVYQHVYADGSLGLTFTSTNAKNAWRAGLGGSCVPTNFTTTIVDISVGTLAANGGTLYNQTTAHGIDTTTYRILGIIGFWLTGNRYTNCSVTKLNTNGANIEWSVTNLGSAATGDLTLSVRILKVAL